MNTGLGRLNGIVLVVDRASRTREVINSIRFDIERKGHVVPHHLEPRVRHQVADIIFAARVKIVHANDIVAALKKSFAEERAKKSSPSGYDCTPPHSRLQTSLPRLSLDAFAAGGISRPIVH
jgi:hypothetical protein